jgi:hypothetical protein
MMRPKAQTLFENWTGPELFGLHEGPPGEIKNRHCPGEAFRPIRHRDPNKCQVNAAYQLLIEYCTGYRFSFTRDEFFEQNPEERLREQFAQDAIWRG